MTKICELTKICDMSKICEISKICEMSKRCEMSKICLVSKICKQSEMIDVSLPNVEKCKACSNKQHVDEGLSVKQLVFITIHVTIRVELLPDFKLTDKMVKKMEFTGQIGKPGIW